MFVNLFYFFKKHVDSLLSGVKHRFDSLLAMSRPPMSAESAEGNKEETGAIN